MGIRFFLLKFIFLIFILDLSPISFATANKCLSQLNGNNLTIVNFSNRLLKPEQIKIRNRQLQLKVNSLLEPKAIEDGADALHRFWQTINSYQTRYKKILDKNNQPITNLEHYFSEYQIPLKFHKYFRINKATFHAEENIKLIPHVFQAPNNKFNNRAGSRDLAIEMQKLLLATPSNLNASTKIVLESLQSFHTAWFNLNKEWAQGLRPEKLQDEEIANQITNVSPILFRFSELMVKDDPYHLLIQRSLHIRLKFLWAKLLKPFEHKPIEESYLALIYMRGIKPSLTSELADFFDAKIKNRKDIGPLPSLTSPLLEQQNFYKVKLYSEIKKSLGIEGDFNLTLPSTPAGSGAQVFLVRDGQKNVVGALKIQARYKDKYNPNNGLDELLSTLSVESYLSINKPDVQYAKVSDFGILNENTYFSIMKPAKNRDLDSWFNSQPEAELQNLIIKQTAIMTASLHHTHENSNGTNNDLDSKPLNFILDTFKGNSLYDIHWMRDFLDSKKLATRGKNINYKSEQITVLNNKIQNAIDDYERDLDTNLELFHRTVTHGDFHGGNIFYDPITNKTTLIDYGGITWTIAKGNHEGTGDPGNDLGRLLAHLLLEDIKTGSYNSSTSYNKLKLFYTSYLKNSGIEIGTKEESILLHSVTLFFHRYFAIQCSDLTGTKFNSKNITSESLLNTFLDAWLEFNPQKLYKN